MQMWIVRSRMVKLKNWYGLRKVDTFYGKNSNLTIRGKTMGSGIRYTDEFKQEVNQVTNNN